MNNETRYDAPRLDATRQHDTTRHDATRHVETHSHDVQAPQPETRRDTTRHDATRSDTTRRNTYRHTLPTCRPLSRSITVSIRPTNDLTTPDDVFVVSIMNFKSRRPAALHVHCLIRPPRRDPERRTSKRVALPPPEIERCSAPSSSPATAATAAGPDRAVFRTSSTPRHGYRPPPLPSRRRLFRLRRSRYFCTYVNKTWPTGPRGRERGGAEGGGRGGREGGGTEKQSQPSPPSPHAT